MIITITIMLNINYSAKYYFVGIEYSKYYKLSKCSALCLDFKITYLNTSRDLPLIRCTIIL